ncbi:general secretion pathway protein GspK [Lysobacter sp. A421]
MRLFGKPGRRQRQVANSATRGAALLLVLWLIVLLTALVGAFAMVARVEHMQGRVLVRGLAADGAARAGVEYAISRLQATDPRLQWVPDGRLYPWSYAGAQVEIRIVDESGKVDLNLAGAPSLAGLLQELGSDRVEASRLAAAIIDWRDPGSLTQVAGGAEDQDYASAGRGYGAKDAPFESITELEQVLGFTPALYAGLSPHVTVHGGLPQPNPAFASQPVLNAMGLDGAAIVGQRGRPAPPRAGLNIGIGARAGGTYSIDSRARLTNGRQSGLRVVVRTGAGRLPGMAYTVLDWDISYGSASHWSALQLDALDRRQGASSK